MPRISYQRPPEHAHYYRYLTFHHGNPGSLRYRGPQAFWDTNISLYTLMNFPTVMTIDSLFYKVGNASAGNVKMALYEDNGGLPDGGALLASVAGAAQPAADEIDMRATVPATLRISPPRSCWIAICHDLANGSYDRWEGGDPAAVGWFRSDVATTYAAFPADPCPVTTYSSTGPGVGVRVASIP